MFCLYNIFIDFALSDSILWLNVAFILISPNNVPFLIILSNGLYVSVESNVLEIIFPSISLILKLTLYGSSPSLINLISSDVIISGGISVYIPVISIALETPLFS